MAKVSFGARSPYGLRVFRDHEMDWLLKRTLGNMTEKAAEIGECLHAAKSIDPKSVESWIGEWAGLAERVERQGNESLAGGHFVSARESYLRASNYYRTAEYACPPSHPRFHELWRGSVNCFHKACPLFSPPIKKIEVQFEGKKLPGYFWSPDDTGKKRPTIIMAGGNDSSIEEIFIRGGFAAVERGYQFSTFEYPGHRGSVHLYPDCVKRPDSETFFGPALDLLQSMEGVDERIAIAGLSYGGYVAARVALHEKRIKAVIPDSPLVDMPSAVLNGLLGSIVKNVPASMLDMVINLKLKRSFVMKTFMEYSEWTWGVDSFSKEIALPSFQGHVIAKDLHGITCPALALVSEDEGNELVRQAKLFYDGISSTDKTLHIFSMEHDGSNDHCQLDNSSRGAQVMFDWLDKVFGLI